MLLGPEVDIQHSDDVAYGSKAEVAADLRPRPLRTNTEVPIPTASLPHYVVTSVAQGCGIRHV
jgi:hypothetical protein